MNKSLLVFLILILLPAQAVYSQDLVDILKVPTDLDTPGVSNGKPAPGIRVRQTNREFVESDVYHVLYLPTDWQPGKKYPVIVEYAGNKTAKNPGTVEDCNLGYGLTEGKGAIWICMPFVDLQNRKNALNWWGDVDATVAYCKETVNRICNEYGGDRNRLFLAGFSRGAIACNYIGLHDDEIASLWKGFLCHSHYDGVRNWNYAESDRTSAQLRLKRLGNRPQFISHEKSVEQTKEYLTEACPDGNFTFVSMPFFNHVDSWVLRDIPERAKLREWYQETLKEQSQ